MYVRMYVCTYVYIYINIDIYRHYDNDRGDLPRARWSRWSRRAGPGREGGGRCPHRLLPHLSKEPPTPWRRAGRAPL